jgi:hypothetical protein
MTGSVRTISAEQAARAIVAACMLLGVDPAKAFEPSRGNAPAGRKARMLAAHGVRARMGIAPQVLARIFALHGPEVAPSQGRKAGFTTDQLLAISEAIGPVDAVGARSRFMEPLSGVPTRSCPKPEARSPKPEARSGGFWL